MVTHSVVLVLAKPGFEELVDRLVRRKLRFRLAQRTPDMVWDRLWLGVTPEDPHYEPSVDGGLFRGEGPRGFCAGADIKESRGGKTEAALWRFRAFFEAGEVDSLCFLLPTRVAATGNRWLSIRAWRLWAWPLSSTGRDSVGCRVVGVCAHAEHRLKTHTV